MVGFTLLTLKSSGILNNINDGANTIDQTRANANLPTDVSISPEDFSNNPELADIFGVEDTSVDLNLLLESNYHFDLHQHQAIDYDALIRFYDLIDLFISALFR
jgi:hypothetical protein